jgi:pyruvate dehydrogenase E1 component beta subunit
MCLEVAEKLAAEGYPSKSWIPGPCSPGYPEHHRQRQKDGALAIVHEAVQTGGFGGEIAARIADSEAFFHLDAPIRRVAGYDIPIPYNPNLERNAVPTPERIEQAVRDLIA